MSESHSTPAPANPPQSKPAKPYPEFPLFPHAAGVWAKKIRGKLVYFGPWSDPDAALAKYLEQKDALHAGRRPRESAEGLTAKELANRFLNAKRARVDSGELTARSWEDYRAACEIVVSAFGKGRLVTDLGPDDFAELRTRLAKRWGPYRLGNTIQRIRSVFKYAADNDLIDRPVRFGPGFAGPSMKTMRLHRAAQGAKLFAAGEVRRMIEAAGPQLRAMVLLGINCGFGNSDVGNLPLSALDLERGWVDFPRPKTGIPRRVPIWPETVEAVRAALAKRPAPKDPADAGLAFVTKYGLPWAKDVADSPVTKETRKLLDRLGINGHRNFYVLRHTFRTIADAAKDQPAADFIMGHESTHMSSHYRETIGDDRLRAVAEHVRRWLFSDTGLSPEAPPAP